MNATEILKDCPAFDQRLADAWRGSLREVASHIHYICQHGKTVSERGRMLLPGVPVHSERVVEGARRQLAYRLPLYLEAIRRVSEAEEKMIALGMPFARSSDEWVL